MSHPPLYVKIASSLNCIVLGSVGLRNIFAPGKPVPFIPGDDTFQLHVWDGLTASDLSSGQIAYSNILGFALLNLVAAKLTTLYTLAKEGTFLRRNLLISFGAMDIIMAGSMLRFESNFQLAGASLKGMCFIHFLEGATFLYDAFFRPRPVKPTDKASKGQ